MFLLVSIGVPLSSSVFITSFYSGRCDLTGWKTYADVDNKVYSTDRLNSFTFVDWKEPRDGKTFESRYFKGRLHWSSLNTAFYQTTWSKDYDYSLDLIKLDFVGNAWKFLGECWSARVNWINNKCEAVSLVLSFFGQAHTAVWRSCMI